MAENDPQSTPETTPAPQEVTPPPAPEKPPKWSEVVSDSQWAQASPQKQLQVFDKWHADALSHASQQPDWEQNKPDFTQQSEAIRGRLVQAAPEAAWDWGKGAATEFANNFIIKPLSGLAQMSHDALTNPDEVLARKSAIGVPDVTGSLAKLAVKVMPNSVREFGKQLFQDTADFYRDTSKQMAMTPADAATPTGKFQQLVGNLAGPVINMPSFMVAHRFEAYADKFEQTKDPNAAMGAADRATMGDALWMGVGHGISEGLEKVLPEGMSAAKAWAVRASAATSGNVTLGHLLPAIEAASEAPAGQKMQAFKNTFDQQDISNDAIQIGFGLLGARRGTPLPLSPEAQARVDAAKKVGPETAIADSEVAAKGGTPPTKSADISMREVNGQGVMKVGDSATTEQLDAFRQHIDKNEQLTPESKADLHAQIDQEVAKRTGKPIQPNEAQLAHLQEQVDSGEHSPEEKAQLQQIVDSYRAPKGEKLAPVKGAVMVDKDGTPMSRVGNGPSEGTLAEPHAKLADETLKDPNSTDDRMMAVLDGLGQTYAPGRQAGHGFQLEDGRIVTRDEAAAAARQNGQVPPEHTGPLQSHELITPKPVELSKEATAAAKEVGATAEMKPEPERGEVRIPAVPEPAERLTDNVLRQSKMATELGLKPGENKDPIKAGLQGIIDHPGSSPVYRQLAKHLLTALGKGHSGIKLVLTANGDTNTAGAYTPTNAVSEVGHEGTIGLNLARRGAGGLQGTLLHEVVHHLTLRKLDPSYAPTTAEAGAIKRLQRIFDHLKATSENPDAHHLSGLHEFVSSLLTDLNLQADLAKLQLPEGVAGQQTTSVLRGVMMALRRLIGIKEGSALDAALNDAGILTSTPVDAENIDWNAAPLYNPLGVEQTLLGVPSYVRGAAEARATKETEGEAEMLPPPSKERLKEVFAGKGRSEDEKLAQVKQGEADVRAETERSGLVPDHKTIQKALGGAAKLASELEDKLKAEVAAKYPADRLTESNRLSTVKSDATGTELPYVERPSGRLDARGLPITEVVPHFTNDPTTTAEQLGRGEKIRPDPETVNANRINPAIHLDTDERGDFVKKVDTEYGEVTHHDQYDEAYKNDPRIQRAPTLVRGSAGEIRGALENARWAKDIRFDESEPTDAAPVEQKAQTRADMEREARDKGFPESLLQVMTNDELRNSLENAPLDQGIKETKISTGFLAKDGAEHVPAPGLMGHYDAADKYLQANGSDIDQQKWQGKGYDWMFKKGFVRIVGGDYHGEDIYVLGTPNKAQLRALNDASIEQRANVIHDDGRVIFRNPDAKGPVEQKAEPDREPVRIARVTDANGNVTHEIEISPTATLQDLTEAANEVHKRPMTDNERRQLQADLLKKMHDAITNGRTGPSAEVIDAQRAARGLEPQISTMVQSDPETWAAMKAELVNNPNAGADLVKELANWKTGERPLKSTEVAMLAREQAIRENTYNNILDEVNNSKTDAEKGEALFRHATALDAVNEVHTALGKGKADTARALRFIQVMVDTDKLTMDRIRAELQAGKAGRPLSAKEEAFAKDIFKQLSGIKNASDFLNQLKELRTDMERVAKLEEHELTPVSVRKGKLGEKGFKQADKEAKGRRAVIEQKMRMTGERDVTSRTALERYKKALATRMEKLEKKIADKNFTRDVRKPIQLDREAMEAKIKYQRLRAQFEAEIDRLKRENRDWLQKYVIDPTVNFSQGAVISSPIAYAKISAMTLNRLIFTPFKDLVSEGLLHIPGVAKVLKKSPRAGFNVQAQALAYTKGIPEGFKDAWKTLFSKAGASDLELEHGKVKTVRGGFVLQFLRRTHSAAKALAVRMEYERSLATRIAHAMNQGVDVSDPLVRSMLEMDAYRDANAERFQQDNRLVSAYQAAVGRLEAPNKNTVTGKASTISRLGAAAIRAQLPVVRVPTNIIAEGFQHTFGSLSGGANVITALVKGVDSLPARQADVINQQLSRGLIGGAMIALGFYASKNIGGYFVPGEKREPTDLRPGEISFMGHTIPRFITHAPMFQPFLLAATFRQLVEKSIEKGDSLPEAIITSLGQSLLGDIRDQPFASEILEVSKAFDPHQQGTFMGQLAKSKIPQAVQWVARKQDQLPGTKSWIDPIAVPRKTKTIKEHVQSAIPWWRQGLEEK